MKRILTILTLLCAISAPMAQEAAISEAPAQAASAPEASAPEAAASAAVEEPAAPVEVVARDGYIYKMQECGKANAGAGSRWGNILSMSFLQVSKMTGLDTLGGSVIAEVAGNAIGGATEGDIDKRRVCITVAFKDGTPDQQTVLPGRTYDSLKLRYRQTVAVRFEDGKPVFPW